MKQRIITGLLLIAVALPPFVLGGDLLRLLLLGVIAIGSYEMIDVLKLKEQKWWLTFFLAGSIWLSYSISSEIYSVFIAVYVIVLFTTSMFDEKITAQIIFYLVTMTLVVSLALRGVIRIYDFGGAMMIYISFACFGSDVGAYFFGVTFGKHKMLERVSPKKTWEGSLGGWLLGFLMSVSFALWKNLMSIEVVLVFSAFLPIVAQLGDLSFSLIKRAAGIKDYGTVFPGHGGVLDRIDSLLFCLMASYAFLSLVEVVI